MKTIILAGGGSGGHVTPILSIFKELRFMKQKDEDLRIVYLGRSQGIERNIFEQQVNAYYSIVTEKWRRYPSLRNLLTVVIVIQSIFQSLKILYPYRKDSTLFHTGGYVALPPAIAAWILRIPVFIHEQTSRAGLANRISSWFAKKIYVSFESTLAYFPKRKTKWVGYPITKSFYMQGRAQRQGEMGGENFIKQVSTTKPLMLVTGGGNGSKFINERILADLDTLTKNYFVLHQVGRKHLHPIIPHTSDSYLPIGLVSPAEWVHLLKRASIVVGRAGAGTVSECIYLNKKALFIPLHISQKKEQLHNAREAQKYIHCRVISEKEALQSSLSDQIEQFVSASPGRGYQHNQTEIARRAFCKKLTSAPSIIIEDLMVSLFITPPQTDQMAKRRQQQSIQQRPRGAKGPKPSNSSKQSGRSTAKSTTRSRHDRNRPRNENNPSRNENNRSRNESNPSRNENNRSRNENNSSRNESNRSRNESNPSRKESNPSRNENKPSRKESNPSRNESNPSRNESNPSRNESNPSRNESNPSRNENNPSRNESNLSRNESNPSRNENNPPRSENNRSRNENNPPRSENNRSRNESNRSRNKSNHSHEGEKTQLQEPVNQIKYVKNPFNPYP